MRNNTMVSGWLCFFIVLFYSSLTYSGSPVFTFTPLMPTSVGISSQGFASVQYRVENQSYKTHQLALVPVSGIQQLTGQGNCNSSFVLHYKEQCILTLRISGKNLQGHIQGGPKLCEQNSDGNPNPLLCYQPNVLDQLNITRIGLANYLYAGTEDGAIYYLANQSLTWLTIPPPPVNGSPIHVFATNSALYVASQNGNVYYSFNQGLKWNLTQSPDGSAVHSLFVTDDALYAGTENGNLMYSRDWGRSWTAKTQPDGSGVKSIFVESPDVIYVGTENGSVEYSTNGGRTWVAINGQPDGSAIRGIYKVKQVLYVNTAHELVYTSTAVAGGGTWLGYAQSVYSLFVNASGGVINAGTKGGYVFSLITGNEIGFITYSPINSVFLLEA